MKTIIDFANKVKSLADGRISNIANVEGTTSAHPYTVGKQLIFNGLLCKATSAISVGDTLAVGTNLALSDNVVEQIYSLNQGLTNSLDNLSHENLLDNPWFTVNQRGNSSYTGNGIYTFDRWKITQENTTISKDSSTGILTFSAAATYSSLLQKFPSDYLEVGKKYTLSVMFSDGTIESHTFTIVNGNVPFIQWEHAPSFHALITNEYSNQWQVFVFDYLSTAGTTDSVSFKAIKLELGSVSTLAMDTAPNYQQELAKCQRYFFNANMANTNFSEIGYGFYDNGYHFVNVPTPVPMRETPTVSMGGTVRAFIDGTRYFISDYSISVSGKNDTSIKIAIHKSDSNLPVYSLGAYSFDNINGLLMFSADL